MPITASIAAPSVIAGSTITGEQPKVTRMEVPGIKGADGDITWQGEWSSSTTYTQNQAVQYNGSAYVALQGNSEIIPTSNTAVWSVMTLKGDTGATGAVGSAGTVTIGTTTTSSAVWPSASCAFWCHSVVGDINNIYSFSCFTFKIKH